MSWATGTHHNVTWTAWHLDPGLIAGLSIALSFYAYGVTTTRPRDDKFGELRALAFVSGSLAIERSI